MLEASLEIAQALPVFGLVSPGWRELGQTLSLTLTSSPEELSQIFMDKKKPLLQDLSRLQDEARASSFCLASAAAAAMFYILAQIESCIYDHCSEALIAQHQVENANKIRDDALQAQDLQWCPCTNPYRVSSPITSNMSNVSLGEQMQYSSSQRKHFRELTILQQRYFLGLTDENQSITEAPQYYMLLFDKTDLCPCPWDPALVENLRRVEESRDSSMKALAWVQKELDILSKQPSSSPSVSLDQHSSLKNYERRGILYFTLTPFRSGHGQLTFSISDDGGTEKGGQDNTHVSLAILVQPVNDRPHFELPSALVLVEDAGFLSMRRFAQALSPGGFDESWQSLSFDIRVQEPAGVQQAGGHFGDASEFSALFATSVQTHHTVL